MTMIITWNNIAVPHELDLSNILYYSNVGRQQNTIRHNSHIEKQIFYEKN